MGAVEVRLWRRPGDALVRLCQVVFDDETQVPQRPSMSFSSGSTATMNPAMTYQLNAGIGTTSDHVNAEATAKTKK